MAIHSEPSEFARQTVTVDMGLGDGPQPYEVEDYWDRVSGQSWMDSAGNFAAINYAMRSGVQGLPIDNEVLYGKVDSLGYLVHVSEVQK